MTAQKRTITIGISLLLCAALISGCGRRGPLELSPDEAAARQEDNNPRKDKEFVPERKFILDGLLQ